MARQKKDPNELNEFEERFLDTYMNMNFNGTLAYLSLKPHVQRNTAEVESSKILSKPKSQDYLDMKKEHIRLKEEVKLEFLVQELKKIVLDVASESIERDDNGRITSKPDRANAIKAIDLLAKLAGHNQPQKIDVTTNGENINQIIWVEKKQYPSDETTE